MSKNVVICGAGFLGFNIAKVLLRSNPVGLSRVIQVSSRNPQKVYSSLKALSSDVRLLSAVPVDITKPPTLVPAFQDAGLIVSLVGLMHGTPKQFEEIQWRGAENVAKAAKAVGAKLIHISAIGADSESKVPYARTKGLAEKSVLEICPDATIIRPSIVFGPGDGFFSRFARLSQFLPFLPVFGGGQTLLQPVYVGDIGRAIEIIARDDPSVNQLVSGAIMEAGGPDIFTYKALMELVLRYTHRRRPIISLPFTLGTVQGAVMEKLPPNLFTLTRAQVEQLKSNNIVNSNPSTSDPDNHISFRDLVERHSFPLKSVYDILPNYL